MEVRAVRLEAQTPAARRRRCERERRRRLGRVRLGFGLPSPEGDDNSICLLSAYNRSGNISPCLLKQLVLELNIWKLLAEIVELLPSRLFLGQAGPLHQDMPHTATLLRLHHLRHLRGGWQKSAI
jgi:hypothetical protein